MYTEEGGVQVDNGISLNLEYSGISNGEINVYSDKVKKIHKELNKSIGNKIVIRIG